MDLEESFCIEYDEDIGYLLIIIDLFIVNLINCSVLFFVMILLGIIIGNGIIVIVCDVENEFLENLFKCDINLKFYSRFVLEILIIIVDYYNCNL